MLVHENRGTNRKVQETCGYLFTGSKHDCESTPNLTYYQSPLDYHEGYAN